MSQSDNKVAIVTGASRGIGAAIAERLAYDGFAVVINYAGKANEAEALGAKIKRFGGEALVVQADVSDPAAVARLFDSAEEAFGGLDVLVNNAGIMRLATLAEVDDALVDSHIAVNLKGVLNTLREAARRLRDGGRIINLSSSVVGLYQPTYAVYAATKARRGNDACAIEGAARPQHHRERGGARADGDGAFPRWQVAGCHRSPYQACAARAPRPARGHRQHRRFPRRTGWCLDQWPGAARQWWNHLSWRVAEVYTVAIPDRREGRERLGPN